MKHDVRSVSWRASSAPGLPTLSHVANPTGQFVSEGLGVAWSKDLPAIARAPGDQEPGETGGSSQGVWRQRGVACAAPKPNEKVIQVAQQPAEPEAGPAFHDLWRLLSGDSFEQQSGEVDPCVDCQLQRAPEATVYLHQIRHVCISTILEFNHRNTLPIKVLQETLRILNCGSWQRDRFTVDRNAARRWFLPKTPVSKASENSALIAEEKYADAGTDDPFLQQKRVSTGGNTSRPSYQLGPVSGIRNRELTAVSIALDDRNRRLEYDWIVEVAGPQLGEIIGGFDRQLAGNRQAELSGQRCYLALIGSTGERVERGKREFNSGEAGAGLEYRSKGGFRNRYERVDTAALDYAYEVADELRGSCERIDDGILGRGETGCPCKRSSRRGDHERGRPGGAERAHDGQSRPLLAISDEYSTAGQL